MSLEVGCDWPTFFDLSELPDWQHTISGTDIRALFISESSL